LVLLRRPRWGIPLLVGATFLDDLNLSAGFALIGGGDLAAFALLPVWMIHRLMRPSELHLPRFWPLPVAFLALMFASMIAGPNPSVAYGNFIREATYILTLIALMDLGSDQGTLKQSLWAMAFMGCGIALHAIATAQGAARIEGFSAPNILGMRLGIATIAQLGLLLSVEQRWQRALLFLLLPPTILGVLMTISRGTYFSLALALLWWARKYWRLSLLLGVVGVLLLLFLPRNIAPQLQRIERRLEMRDTSVINRWQVAQNALKAIQAQPLLGIGFGQFQHLHKVVEVSAEKGRGTHSFYLGNAAAVGLPAFFILMLFLFSLMRGLWRRRALAERAQALKVSALLSLFQALMIFHFFNLAVRGAARITEWTLFGLFAAAGMLSFKEKPSLPESKPGRLAAPLGSGARVPVDSSPPS